MEAGGEDWQLERCFGDICAMLTMKLFGPLDIDVGGTGPKVFGSPALAELLALLTLHHNRGLSLFMRTAIPWLRIPAILGSGTILMMSAYLPTDTFHVRIRPYSGQFRCQAHITKVQISCAAFVRYL